MIFIYYYFYIFFARHIYVGCGVSTDLCGMGFYPSTSSHKEGEFGLAGNIVNNILFNSTYKISYIPCKISYLLY